MPAPYLTDPARLAAIAATELVDTPAEECFDKYTRLAKKTLAVEMAIVSLVMEDRQFYKSCVGLIEPLASERGSPISFSLCKIGVESREPLAISDGPNDPIYHEHTAITELKLHSYLGIPIFDENEHALGTLCVANTVPREWSAEDIENLSILAAAVRNEILLRKFSLRQKNADTEHELLGKILETTVAAIVVLDTSGTIVFCNDGAERILGLKPSAIEGRAYDDPEWQSTALDGGPFPSEVHPFSLVLSTGAPVYDIQHAIVWPDGTRKIISVNGAPLKSAGGEIMNLVFQVHDITKASESNQNFEKVAAQFRGTFKISPNFAVLSRRDDGVIEEVSDGLLKSLKVERVDCVGKRLDQIDVGFTQEEIDQLYAADSIEAGAEIELRLNARNDQLRLIVVRAQTIEVGTHRFLRITGQDMTDQRAEEQRRSALEVQLREAQRTEVIGQLAGGLAHDFNNILTAIIGNSELAAARIEGDHPAQKSIGVIKKAGQRAVAQIRQIMDLGNRDVSNESVIEVFPVIAECIDLVASQMPSSVAIRVEPPLNPSRVLASSSHLHQILMNLLTNAVQSIGEDGDVMIRIDPQTDDKTDELSANDPVVIEVTDDGSGIDPVNMGRIFEAFFTTKRNGVGSGIGLTLARTIARSYGGDLSVVSTLGQGATFRLQLPRLPEENQAAANAQDPFGIREGQAALRILLVDDDEEVLFTGAMMIEQLGHTVTSSADPVAALESLNCADSRYDLLITDNMMPKLTGIELIQKMREDGVDTPAVLVSGYGTARTQIEKLGCHNAVFVAKPFSMEEIAAAINASVAS